MATYDERQPATLGSMVEWLAEQLHDAKQQIARQAQELEGLKAHLWELNGTLHRTEEAVAAIPPHLEMLPRFEHQLDELTDELHRVGEHGLQTEARLVDLGRVRQTEQERDRAVLNELAHRMEAVERGIAAGGPRFEALEEATRRTQEAISTVRQRLEETGRAVEGLDGRLVRVVDAGGRTEQEFARVSGELEALRRQDVMLAERVQVYTEMLRRLEAQITAVSGEVAVKQDVLDRIELNRIGAHRMEERLSLLEAAALDLREIGDDVRRQLTLLDGRDRGLYDRLAGLQTDLAAYRTVVQEQFKRLQQAQERLKRRQIEDLEREIREMRIHAFRPVEE
jgi:chromosome segregation ATPase